MYGTGIFQQTKDQPQFKVYPMSDSPYRDLIALLDEARNTEAATVAILEVLGLVQAEVARFRVERTAGRKLKIDWSGLSIPPGLRRWEFDPDLEDYEIRLLTQEFKTHGLK
jgi:hypothetical protein